MSGRSSGDMDRWWSDVLQDFISSDDHTVELTQAEPYGVQVVVDGTPMFAASGYPWETFTVGKLGEVWGSFTDEGREKIRSDETDTDRGECA